MPKGILIYHGLGTWMGYAVRWDWTPPWLLAASIVSILSLGVHFLRKYGLLARRRTVAPGIEAGAAAVLAVSQGQAS